MKTIKLYSLCMLLSLLMGCNKWIDIQPSDQLSEAKLFENKEGYMKALNGVYVEMANNTLYGQFLTAGALDAMGQYYFATNTSHNYLAYMTFGYTMAIPKAGFDAVWSRAYAAIYNLNVLIENCGKSPSPKLPNNYFNLIKGEALALRAFLHFDMLRLFGPVYNTQNKDQAAIPYYTSSNREVTPLKSSEEILALIAEDLKQAKVLLQESDPILTTGLGNTSVTNGDNTFAFRQYRLNYYAIQALQARIYLWRGDRQNAGKTARETIAAVQQVDKELFPFVTTAQAMNSSAPDRVFTSEVLFSIYKLNRSDVYDNLFAPSVHQFQRLTVNAGNADLTRVNAIYDDKNDYRYKVWETIPYFDNTLVTNQKYKTYENAIGNYMLPLIRIGELYLIAAECTEDLSEAKTYLNTLRLKRNAINLNPSDTNALTQLIAAEYRRELLGEGQMFFFYKRKAYTEIPNNASLTGNKAMLIQNYQVPLPDSEISVRTN
ncbi:SusD family protein [Sphingobacterium nematocida]|uniref:SusD family protein n=1 Tax=Sphingobacterium nematocida TaxID=1513896 RepID=A0A1T5AV01_9SPHI|nr:RagB/SusD family nutrient uptake outer membrane protein [Sphingobacterium nematocida]SKB38802.1 SusD family protein [Sphingobacterium nematocida]